MGDLTKAAQAAEERREVAGRAEATFHDLLVAQVPAMKKVMSDAVTPARFLQVGMECYRRNPQLAECPPDTVVSALMTCSALGLEPTDVDHLQRAFILPRWNSRTKRREATFQLGVAGAIELMTRSGKVLDVDPHVVYERDQFEYVIGREPPVMHTPYPGDDPGKVVAAYCVATLPGGVRHYDVMWRRDIEKRRAASDAGKKGVGPWKDWYEEMAMKTVVLHAAKSLPRSPELRRAMDAEGATEYVAPDTGEVA